MKRSQISRSTVTVPSTNNSYQSPQPQVKSNMRPRIVLVLGDQLTPGMSSLAIADKGRDIVLMVEVQEETRYVPHHKKKVAFILSAMRHFAEELRRDGWTIDYVTLDDPSNTGSFTGEVGRAIERHDAGAVIVTEPGEWRIADMIGGWANSFGIPVHVQSDRRFLCTSTAFADWARGRKQLRMEYFYRDMRKKSGLLMSGDTPEGGQWNYDAENRKPAGANLVMPKPRRAEPDATTRAVLHLVGERLDGHFGDLQPFWFAVTRADAELARDTFLAEALPHFGDYQDAMLKEEKFLYHSILSLYLNVGLLDPLDLCRRVEAAYRSGGVPLNAAEGFIRQVIGWREFVRGIYWLRMPGYTDLNFLGANRPLPEFYWTGETDMACVEAAVEQTREEAYAHHIQRLMVTGNFALIAGIDPKAVHEWYLAVYADAFEWVEAPNTLGMSQFADGGLLGSKPYAASGNYINKMSNYCRSCRYDVKARTGEGACPFNALYWDFLDRNASKLKGNPRLAQVYATWSKMGEADRDAVRLSANRFLLTLKPWNRPSAPSPRSVGTGSDQSNTSRRPRRAPTSSAT